MEAPVLVTGGTGVLGGLVVPRLHEAGRDVRVLSRHSHEPAPGVDFVVGDLATGEGVAAATAGVEVVVHCAGGPRGDADKTRRLVEAAAEAGVRHVVSISVVGADRIPMAGAVDRGMFGYFGSKRAAEQVVSDCGLPWSTLRAAQFYDLVLTVARTLARLPVVPVFAGFRFQPVDAAEVADRLVELALGHPAGLVPDLAGPRVYPMADLVTGYLQASGIRRPIVSVPLPGAAAHAFRTGANLAPDRADGKRTWEEFLDERVTSTGEG